jgi:hypothetical protein
MHMDHDRFALGSIVQQKQPTTSTKVAVVVHSIAYLGKLQAVVVGTSPNSLPKHGPNDQCRVHTRTKLRPDANRGCCPSRLVSQAETNAPITIIRQGNEAGNLGRYGKCVWREAHTSTP